MVFSANVFLVGLRQQLYFLIGGLLERLIYLSYGLAFLLGIISVKPGPARDALERAAVDQRPWHIDWAPRIPIWLSPP